MNRELLVFFLHPGHGEGLDSFIRWVGNYHTVLLHFPIALIMMTVVAEILYVATKNETYNGAAKFMIIGAAVTALPTALLGLAYSLGTSDSALLEAHKILGISTALLAILTAVLRSFPQKKSYAITLSILFISVAATAYLGGEMTFGAGNLLPPRN